MPGQNSAANLAHLAATGLGFIGSIPPSDCPDLLARPATDRHVVDPDRFPGLTALEDRRHVYGADRRVVLTHSQTLHTAQSRGFDQTLAKATAKLSVLADTLAAATPADPATRSPPRSPRSSKTPGCDASCPGSCPVTPAEHRLAFDLDDQASTDLEAEIFGKRVLMTDRDHWPTAEVVAGYRSQSEAEFGFRQLKDPHVVSFSPMHHWTEHNIRVHVFTRVLALQIAHLMRRHAHQHGLHLSVRELLDTLAGIQETVLMVATAQSATTPSGRTPMS